MDSETSSSAPMPTLSRLAFKAVCGQLEKSLSNEKASASFACGGTIPVDCTVAASLPRDIAEEVPGLGERLKSSRPVNIFWELKDEPTPRKLTLPLDSSVDNDSPDSLTRLRQLVADSDFGIVERVQQVLLPAMQSLTGEFLKISRLDIELYKLNAYSGPSGLSKSHVDITRSASQIGSLVVCLPSPFQGGNLVVRHEGREVNFYWEQRSADTIQWAAFYSDCEHEIKTVNQGARITLTYNLYAVSELLEKSNRISVIIDPKSLPLYEDFKNLLETPAFMRTGGVLGAFCSHAYPHATSDASFLLPRGLKGADLAFFSALHASGVKVDVLPVILGHGARDPKREWSDSGEDDWEDQDKEDVLSKTGTPEELEESDHDYNSDQDELAFMPGNDNDDGWNFDALPDMLGRENQANNDGLWGWGDQNNCNESDPVTNADKDNEDGDNDGDKGRCKNKGNQLRKNDDPLAYLDLGTTGLHKHWPTQSYKKPITWVTAPRPENMRAAMAYITYVDDASQMHIHSYAAIIAVIPPWTERQKLLAKLKDQ
ncbi:hypothetical protein PMG11_09046 [Penicillium brasilianum]|uniref:Fe2OG dioxygenase domain-containing protein n=1 Tax=Penicillium brasilianum TaxID=104259 RepID=A0A0F7TUU5_PENBI|nr:hypothetical protein PMG11_09046 [Penicillium brasilianum]